MHWWYADNAESFINLAQFTSIKVDADKDDLIRLTLISGTSVTCVTGEDAIRLGLYLRGCCPLQQRERWQQESKVRV